MATATPQDPRKQELKQPFPKQKQQPPGTEQELQPKADHGEKSYQGHGRLKGRKALITGADSGIGRAVAIAFAREGADVALCYLPGVEDADADETARWVEHAGVKCLRVPGDIQDSAHCREMIAQVVRSFGGIDILVNNAAFQMTHLLPYAATKAAIVNFTKGLSQELAERGIRVNAVAPGPVWTPLIPASHMDTESFVQRAAQPAEMAPIYVLLASTESSYVTGMVYGATGGQLMP